MMPSQGEHGVASVLSGRAARVHLSSARTPGRPGGFERVMHEPMNHATYLGGAYIPNIMRKNNF